MDPTPRAPIEAVKSAMLPESQSLVGALSAIDHFKRFNVTERIRQMDDQSLNIADRQEESLQRRKQLAEITKDFKRADTAERTLLFPNLLKSYQDEIDALTLRSKAAEILYLELYRDMRTLPDPVPMLQSGLESSKKLSKLSEKDDEIRKLKLKNDEYLEELQTVKNQEVTVRRLDEQIRDLQAKMADMVKQGVSIKEKVLKEEFIEAQAKLKEKERELLQKIQSKDEQARQESMNASLAQAKLLELQEKMESILGEKQELYDLTYGELQRAHEKIVTLERALELHKISPGQSISTKVERIPKTSLERELDTKNILIDELRGHIAMLERQLFMSEQKAVEHISLVQKKNEEIKSLQSEVITRPTMEKHQELKRQFLLLQGLKYAIGVGDYSTQLKEDGLDFTVTEFEEILLENHRSTCAELSKEKIRLSDLEANLHTIQQKCMALQSEVHSLKELNQTLEKDLEIAYSDERVNPKKHNIQAPGTSTITEGMTQIDEKHNVNEIDANKPTKNSLLQIISGQRDRFRERVDELEKTNRSLKEQNDKFKQDLSSLENDNIKLYEKIRYLQNFSHNRDRDIEAASSSIESKYSKLYEESINPFAQFHKKEAMKRYKELNTADRVTLIISNILHGSKQARTFVFFYTIILHFFVFVMLYQLANFQCQIYEVSDAGDIKVGKGGIGPNHL